MSLVILFCKTDQNWETTLQEASKGHLTPPHVLQEHNTNTLRTTRTPPKEFLAKNPNVLTLDLDGLNLHLSHQVLFVRFLYAISYRGSFLTGTPLQVLSFRLHSKSHQKSVRIYLPAGF